MSLINDYMSVINTMKAERQAKYEQDYANWQQGEANRQKMIGTAVGVGVGALTGGLGGLPFLGIAPGAGGALAGAGLSMIPGGLQMGTMQRAAAKTPETKQGIADTPRKLEMTDYTSPYSSLTPSNPNEKSSSNFLKKGSWDNPSTPGYENGIWNRSAFMDNWNKFRIRGK